MDKLIEEEIRNCIPCQSTTRKTTRQLIQTTPIPENVWQTVNIDNKYTLLIIDQRSRYPVVSFTSSANTNNLISICNEAFTNFGYPETVISDSGPPFQSKEVRDYLSTKSIKHRRINPLWPQANEEVERYFH